MVYIVGMGCSFIHINYIWSNKLKWEFADDTRKGIIKKSDTQKKTYKKNDTKKNPTCSQN